MVALCLSVAILGCVLVPPWNPAMLSFGPALHGIRLPRAVAESQSDLEALANRDEIVFHREGMSATVTIKKKAREETAE